MYLQRNVLFVENSSEGVEQETDRIVQMSTGEDGAHIGTRYSYYNVERNVQFCGTSMSGLGKKSTVVAKVTKTFPMLDALTKAHILF